MMPSTPPPDGELTTIAELLATDDTDAPFVPISPSRGLRIAGLVTAIVLVLALVASGGYVAWALTAPLPDPTLEWHAPSVETPGPAQIDLPSFGASAVSVGGADVYLGESASGIWLTSGAQDAQPMASVSKIITALVVLEKYPLADASDPGPTITFSKADHDLYDQYYVRGATIAAMPTGTTMSLHDALATMLIPSASNYAEAIARWAFGSVAGFRSAARAWLDAHGLSGTTVVEPTGLDARNVSTPADLVAAGKLAAADPTISAIAATSSLTLPGPGAMQNTNALLGVEGITGLKTGNLGYGTYAFLFTAGLDVGALHLDVAGAIQGGATRESVNADALRILDSLRRGFHDVRVGDAGQKVGTVTAPWGGSTDVVIADDVDLFTWSDTPITVEVIMADAREFARGDVVGELTWTAGPHEARTNLIVAESLDPPTEWWRLTHPGELLAQ